MGNEKVDAILNSLEDGVKNVFSSENFTKYLQTMSTFHSYSLNNLILIFSQKPEATCVAGFNAWKKHNRTVKAKEKGIKILAPCIYNVKNKKQDHEVISENGAVLECDEDEETARVLKGFKVVYVFDVSQTTGEDLPSICHELSSSVENYNTFIKILLEFSKYPVLFKSIKDSKGYFSNANSEIVVKSEMSQAQTIKTLIHELTHSILHCEGGLEEKADRDIKEIEAESVAYAVCNYFGIDTSDYSFEYIASWSHDADLGILKNTLNVIKNTTHTFIEYVENQLSSLIAV